MQCVYCPISTYENFTPREFRNRGLSYDDYLSILCGLLEAIAFEKVSLTGGEPLLNHRLDHLAAEVRSLVPQLELNTNGLLLTDEKWQSLAGFFDQVKISLDTIAPEVFGQITGIAHPNALRNVISAINIVKASRTEVVINAVLMQRTLPYILELAEFAVEHEVRLHVLDFSFTDERRQIWEREFLRADLLMAALADRYGKKTVVPRFGVGYFEYRITEQTTIRVRSSYAGSMRSERCQNCTHYCQTGLFGLMLSTDGWVTTCQGSYCEEDGVLLEPDMTPKVIRESVTNLIHDLASAKHVPDSFSRLINLRGLNPASLSIKPRQFTSPEHRD